MSTNGEQRPATKPGWLAWAVSIGELLVLLIFAFALSRYWLMLPVWMRRTAGAFLVLALLVILYRLARFTRKEPVAGHSQGTGVSATKLSS